MCSLRFAVFLLMKNAEEILQVFMLVESKAVLNTIYVEFYLVGV